MECKLNNVTLSYETHGEGKPILMLHGYTVDRGIMLGCMEPLFQDGCEYRRIYPDLPGMGKTKGESWITNSDQMLDIVINFIDKVIGDETFLIAGESYGGYLARGIILRMPERVEGLLMLCPGIVMTPGWRNAPEHTVLEKDEQLLSELDPADAKGFASINVILKEKIWEKYRDDILPGLKAADYPFLDNLYQKGYAFSFDVDKLVGKFTKPTLMLLGRQDAVVGYKDAWDNLDNYPRATFAVLDKAGHNLQIEQEQLFQALVKEWLERVSNFSENGEN